MISASMIKELRETTGAGMLDCKKALEETNGNMEEAINWLREKGISKAAKKATRIAAEGLALSKTKDNKALIIEVNSETDFVAKNEEFKDLVNLIADTILNSNVSELEESLGIKVNDKSINDLIVEKIAKLGEKLSFRRLEIINKDDNQTFGTYSHMGGKIVSIVLINGNDEELAKDIAMQVAAMKPLYVANTDVPSEVLDKERAILTEQAENEGLDGTKIPMIVNGRINKYYEDVCLLDQIFIKDKVKVGKYVSDKNSKIISFIRYEVGEGIEKKEENFADEVMKQINN